MSRIHDMGGRYGDGAIPDKDDNIVFHSEWEARVLATTLAIGSLGLWNIDASRHSRERLIPKDYASFSYYEKWLAAVTNMLVENGALTLADLDQAGGDTPPAELAPKALKAENVANAMSKSSPYIRAAGPTAKFNVGDLVRTVSHSPNHISPGGHTRLPAYAMGKTGRVVIQHGNHVLPDSNAHKNGEAPEPLYAIEFQSAELWPDDAEDARDTFTLDLWQNYLELA